MAIGLVGAIFALTPLGVDFEKHVGLTWLFNVRGTVEPPPGVSIIAINERTAAELGLPKLPREWPRSIHGQLIDKLVDHGASVVVFDMDFQHAKSRDHDLSFAQSIRDSGRVVLFERLNGRRQPIFDVHGQQTGTIWAEELVPPIPDIADSARALAPFPLPKVQASVFQFWAFKPSAGDVGTMPSVALQLLAAPEYEQWRNLLEQAGMAHADRLPRTFDRLSGAEDVRLMMQTVRRGFIMDPALEGRVRHLLENSARAEGSSAATGLLGALTGLFAGHDNRYLNFYGPPGTIPTIPYHAVMSDEVKGYEQRLDSLRGSVVFVGYSDLYDPGQPDRFYTVFTSDSGVDLSGVEIAATGFANLLTGSEIQPSGWLGSFLVLMIFGTVVGSTVYLLNAWISVPLAVLAGIIHLAAAQYVFDAADYWLPLATPLLAQLPMALLIGLMCQYQLEHRRQQRYSKALSYYLPEHAARELTEKELDPNSLNKVVYGICFATDMSGFTAISQTMDPSELADFMNSYFDALATALKRHDVDVTEFHADTIMCAWTADGPLDMDRHKPPQAALATLDAVNAFNASMSGVNLNARVGMDEGRFFLGHTGGGGRMGYSILGDCANTAARLESLNKHLRTHILANESIVSGTDQLLLRPVGRFVLVGKSEPLPVVEVMADIGTSDARQRELCGRFGEALEVYNRHQWASAGDQFSTILADYPDDGPSDFYLARCRAFQNRAPEGDDPSAIRMNAK